MRFFSLITLLFLFSLSVQVPESRAVDTAPDIGKYAPPFELRDLPGKIVSLASYRGKVVLLNFWSTLCAPCMAEMPSLNGLAAAFKDKDFIVLGVSIDASDKPVREFALKNNIKFSILLDKEKEVFFDQYAGPCLPAAYLINRDGIIVETFNGQKEWDSQNMKEKVMKLLEKR